MKDTPTPKWLTDIQNNSYLPELMISGASLYALFSLDQSIVYLSYSIKEYFLFTGINAIAFIMTFTLFSALTALKVILISHLVLRMIWTGYVGLSFVFPDGINREKVKFKGFFTKAIKENNQATRSIISLETVCSLTFAFAIMFIFIMFGLLLILSVISILLLINVTLLALLIAPLVFYFIDFLLNYSIRKSKIGYYLILPGHLIVRYLGLSFIFRKIFHTFQTNIGFYKTIILLFSFLILGFLSSYGHIASYMHWRNLFDTKKYTRIIKNSDYENRIGNAEAFDNLTLERYYLENDDYLTIFVIYDKGDDILLENLYNVNDHKDDFEENTDLYFNIINQIYINDSLYSNLSWVMQKHLKTNQLGLKTKINIRHLERRKYWVELKKLRHYRNNKNEYYSAEFVSFEKQ